MNQLIFQAEKLGQEGDLEKAYECWVDLIKEYWHPDLHWIVQRVAPIAKLVGKQKEFRQVYFKIKRDQFQFCQQYPIFVDRPHKQTGDTIKISCPDAKYHLVIIAKEEKLEQILACFKEDRGDENVLDVSLIVYVVDQYQTELNNRDKMSNRDNLEKVCLIGIDTVYHNQHFSENKGFKEIFNRYAYRCWKQTEKTEKTETTEYDFAPLIPYLCHYSNYHFNLIKIIVIRPDYLSQILRNWQIDKLFSLVENNPLTLSQRNDSDIEDRPDFCMLYGHFDLRLIACNYQFNVLKAVFVDWVFLIKHCNIYEQNWLDSIFIKYNLYDTLIKKIDLDAHRA